MAYKLLWHKPIYLLSKTKVGSITAFYDTGQSPYHLICCWGTTLDGYTWCDFGSITDSDTTALTFSEYEDSLISCLYISGFPNVHTITELSGSTPSITHTATIDVGYIAVGVAATTSGDGYTVSLAAGEATTVSRTRYINWVRDRGHLLASSASLVVLATDPVVCLNSSSVAMIANYQEVSVVPDGSKVNVTTQRYEARVRWGDLGSAYCQIIEGEADGSAAGYQDLIDTPGPITAGIVLSDRVVCFKPDSVYELTWTGSPGYFTKGPTVMGNGTRAPYSVRKTGVATCTFKGVDGFYEYTLGGDTKRLSDRVDPYIVDTYTKTQIEKAFTRVYPERNEIWMNFKDTDSIIYKVNYWVYKTDMWERKHHILPWVKSDYSTIYGSDFATNPLVFMGEALDTKEIVPHLFFDETDAILLEDSATSGYKKITLKSYYDRQTSYNTAEATLETKDYPLALDSRVEGLEVQVISEAASGTLYISYSTDEGTNYSSETTLKVHSTPQLEWYNFTFDTTGESIRFKFRTSTGIHIGRLKLKVAIRKRGQKEA